MPAEIEEVVLHAHLVELEQLLPDLGDHALHLVAGSHVRRLPSRRRTPRAAVPFVEAGNEDTISESGESRVPGQAREDRRQAVEHQVSSESRPNMLRLAEQLQLDLAPGVTVSVNG